MVRKPFQHPILKHTAGSSNGRTTAFGAVYHGSNPCPAAFKKRPPSGGFFETNELNDSIGSLIQFGLCEEKERLLISRDPCPAANNVPYMDYVRTF